MNGIIKKPFLLAVLGDMESLTDRQAQIIADALNQLSHIGNYWRPAITGDYLLSPTLTMFIAETHEREHFNLFTLIDMQGIIEQYCDESNFVFEYLDDDERDFQKMFYRHIRRNVAEWLPVVERALNEPISYAEYRCMYSHINFAYHHLAQVVERGMQYA